MSDDREAVLERRRLLIAAALTAIGCGAAPEQRPSPPATARPNGSADPPSSADAPPETTMRETDAPAVAWSELLAEAPPLEWEKTLPNEERQQLVGTASPFALHHETLRALYEAKRPLCDLREGPCTPRWEMAAASLLRVEAATHVTPRLCGVGDDVRGIVLRLHDNHTAFLRRLHAAVTDELDRQVASTGPLSEQVWLKARTPRRRTIALPCLSCEAPKVERYHETVPFDAGSSTVSERMTSLTEWAKRIAPRNQLVEVRGHADATEPDPEALSLARANAVRAILLKAGLDAARVTAFGFGAEMPVATNKTPEGRTQNRELWLESVLSLPRR